MSDLALMEILDAWDLLSKDVDLRKYSMGDWKKIEEAVSGAAPSKPTLGAVHLGLNDGIEFVEGIQGFAPIAPYALAFQTVWLPDPVFTFLSHEARKAFELLPECRGTFFDSEPGATVNWKNLWMTRPEERRPHILASLPRVLARLRELRPLAELGAVRFFRWEPLLFAKRNELRAIVSRLAQEEDVRNLTQRVPQENYSLGIRGGRIGITAGGDFTGPGPHPKKGEPMFFANKTPMVLSALMNASVSTALASSFAPAHRGDRMLYDCFVSGGHVETEPKTLATAFRLPQFAEAVLPDLVAIRRDSEAMALFRDVLRDAAGETEEAALPTIEARLREAAARIAEDASLWKAVRDKSTEGSVASLATGLATYALDPASTGASAATAAIVAAVAFLASLLPTVAGKASEERKAKQERSELILRTANKL